MKKPGKSSPAILPTLEFYNNAIIPIRGALPHAVLGH